MGRGLGLFPQGCEVGGLYCLTQWLPLIVVSAQHTLPQRGTDIKLVLRLELMYARPNVCVSQTGARVLLSLVSGCTRCSKP